MDNFTINFDLNNTPIRNLLQIYSKFRMTSAT